MKKHEEKKFLKVIRNENYGNRKNLKRVEYKTAEEQIKALEVELREKKAIAEMLANRIKELRSYNNYTHDDDMIG